MTSEAWSKTHKEIIKDGRIYRYRYCDVLRMRLRGAYSGGGRRSVIANFSKASARRFRFAFETRPKQFREFVTLTFPREVFSGDTDIAAQRETLYAICREFLQRARRLPGIYLWVAEPQKDGTPHLHFLVSGSGSDYQLLWQEIITNRLGFYHKYFMIHGTDVRPISQAGIERYLAKTCAYAVKTAEGVSAPLMIGWRRWGRNYTSVPWAVEGAHNNDFALGVFATALCRRPNALICNVIVDTGVLHGAPLDEEYIIEVADDPPNQFVCYLTSGARNRMAFNY